jgi:hypothetical protein
MLTTAGDTRLITGAKEGSADCAETPEETPNAAMASKAAKNFFIENNLDGARCLTGCRRHKFRCAIALIFPRADASVNDLCVFCAYFVHTRCGTARKIGPDRTVAQSQAEIALDGIRNILKAKGVYSRKFSIRKSLTAPPSRNNFATLTQDLVVAGRGAGQAGRRVREPSEI